VHLKVLIFCSLLTGALIGAPPPRSGPPRPGPSKPGPPRPGASEAPKQDEQEKSEPKVPATVPLLPRTLGHAGESPIHEPEPFRASMRNAVVASPDRWRLGWLPWDRYGRSTANDPLMMNATGGDSPYTAGHPINPYDRNVLKGDYPIAGDDIFLNATVTSDTFYTFNKLPVPSGVSAANAASFDFFGDGEVQFVQQNVFVTAELFQGYTAFRPVDWLVRVTGAFNVNHLRLQENNNVNVDVREGDIRDDSHAAIQEAFFEYHLGDVSPKFDIMATKIGRQLFVSDFRGFIFNDASDGIRLLGNLASNQVQYNVALFNQLDKDTNSELNELDWRDQQVLIANLYIQDFIWKGYTTQFSFHWNHDQSDREFDNNGFLVIPDLAGSVTLHDIDAYYLGWAGDGHIGRVNVNHAFYYVFGEDNANPIAGREVDLGAYMGALELSLDLDWFRPKASFLYASGDDDPLDGKATGFDGIQDNPFFAGGPSSFYQSQALRLFGLNLVSARSFYNDLAGTKAEGQSNFVNPGTMIFNAGFEAEITPKLRASFNANSIWFTQTETLELFLNQASIDPHIGDELNLTFQYRPFLNNNVIFTVGGSTFFPSDGFVDMYDDDQTLFQLFTALTLTY